MTVPCSYFFAIRVVEKFAYKAAYDLAELANQHYLLTGEQPIRSILVPVDVKGVIIVEGSMKHEILPLIRQVKQARGMLRGKLTLEEVIQLSSSKEDIFDKGTLIRVTNGPFQNCAGRVISDDGIRLVVELLEWERENRITLRRSQVTRTEEDKP